FTGNLGATGTLALGSRPARRFGNRRSVVQLPGSTSIARGSIVLGGSRALGWVESGTHTGTRVLRGAGPGRSTIPRRGACTDGRRIISAADSPAIRATGHAGFRGPGTTDRVDSCSTGRITDRVDTIRALTPGTTDHTRSCGAAGRTVGHARGRKPVVGTVDDLGIRRATGDSTAPVRSRGCGIGIANDVGSRGPRTGTGHDIGIRKRAAGHVRSRRPATG